MRRRLFAALLWSVLVPIVGLWNLLLAILQLFLALRPKTQLTLLALALALAMPNPITAQFRAAEFTPDEKMNFALGIAVVGSLGVLMFGVRSRRLRRLRRGVERFSWSRPVTYSAGTRR